MTAHAGRGSKGLRGVAAGVGLRRDARILRRTVLESIRTSPAAFLSTVAEIEAKTPAYWEIQLRSSTWAVLEARRGIRRRVVGIAAAKQPGDNDKKYANLVDACFIESVWITPRMRRRGLGMRLVNFLIDMRRQDGIQRFYLWVFENNKPAVELYEHMDFKETGQTPGLAEWPVREVQYLLDFDSDVVDDSDLAKNEAARKDDRRRYGITYRLLGREASGSRPRNSKAPITESV
jgi:GNAT superfamily N-acetyltransferase